jgi:hypothetical protein
MFASHRHAVKFYANEQSLYTTVAGFLGQAITDGQVGILIATAAHRREIIHNMRTRMLDVDNAQHTGALLLLDAGETMARIMVGGMPDARAFEDSIGALIATTLAGNGKPRTIRAYGEVVDVLCKDGKPEAAIALEILWNKLAAKYSFSLLCGYSMGHFYEEANQFEGVCRQHTHVLPPDELGIG